MSNFESYLESGFTFQVPKKLTGFLSKSKYRTFLVEPIKLSALAKIGDQRSLIEIESWDGSILENVNRRSFRLARVVSIAVLGFWSFVPALPWLLAWYLHARLDGKVLFNIHRMIYGLSNYQELISSINLLGISPRTTQPHGERNFESTEEDDYSEIE